jgi:hypothetical protein
VVRFVRVDLTEEQRSTVTGDFPRPRAVAIVDGFRFLARLLAYVLTQFPFLYERPSGKTHAQTKHCPGTSIDIQLTAAVP